MQEYRRQQKRAIAYVGGCAQVSAFADPGTGSTWWSGDEPYSVVPGSPGRARSLHPYPPSSRCGRRRRR